MKPGPTGIYPKLAFAAYLVVLMATAGVQQTLFYRPQSVHQWRQADCTSQSLNYYQNDISFWTPQMHTRQGKNGFAASEFPLIYYITAKLYGLFGFHEFLHRGLNLLIAVLSWWLLFLLSARLIGNAWLGLIPVVFLSTAPYYFFYANNFLPNVPGLAFALMGWYAFIRYRKGERPAWLYAFGLLMLLSALFKVSDAISFVAVIGLAALSQFNWKGLPERLLPRRHWGHFALIVAIVVGLTAWWYLYARHFNEVNGNKQSLQSILPIWQMSDEDWRLADYMILDIWWTHYQHPVWTYLLVALGLCCALLWRKLNPFLKWATLLLFLGTLAYSLLWFKAFPMHDYYAVTQLIFPVFLLITILEFVYRWLKARRQAYTYALGIVLAGLSVLGIVHNAKVQSLRYDTYQFQSHLPQGMYELEPYLRSIGINREALVVSVPDASPNITLYLMNNPGFTEAFHGPDFDMAWLQSRGAEYLVVNDSSYLQKERYQPYLGKQVGSYKGILVFDIRKE
ncbi:MAG: glycosyltransferase family 39 protein [Phaeodactylibacter sp.]|nr:glycosyltransferase family 39 protein [Phaeodactylibacter sp.]MCB9276864.1 glycosyltransferase family 39 protein [Lewinellaceae bacterium]